ncbi:hypothetical protein HZB00_02445 [Candidatus Woesearchaeota archaeon]|nr:hypothetical protein [Candidatus Woesearchaeota archaeon]
MTAEIPEICLRAYGVFFSRFGTETPFKQSVLDWIVGQSMKKKIFSILLTAGWLEKRSYDRYICKKPESIMQEMGDFKVPAIMKESQKPYAFTGASAVEIWSDYCYVQRSREKSPYFIKIAKKDISYWKQFFSKQGIYYYFEKGCTIGEYVIIIPVKKPVFVEKEGIKVEPKQVTIKFAEKNEMFAYPYKYMKKKDDDH